MSQHHITTPKLARRSALETGVWESTWDGWDCIQRMDGRAGREGGMACLFGEGIACTNKITVGAEVYPRIVRKSNSKN